MSRPNHFEAESLSGLEITNVDSLKAAAIRIHELSGAAVLAKGATPLGAARTAKSFVTAGIRNRVASGAPFDALWQGGPR